MRGSPSGAHTRMTDPPRRWCTVAQFGFGFGGGIIRLMITLFIIQVRIAACRSLSELF
jgi:hypothetical protein